MCTGIYPYQLQNILNKSIMLIVAAIVNECINKRIGPLQKLSEYYTAEVVNSYHHLYERG
jgi:hypothetical protein